MIYFDHAATTPPFEDVVRTVAEVMSDIYGNPSSLHRKGAEAETLLNRARSVAAETLSVPPEGIVFTSGGTESNNLAIFGCVDALNRRSKKHFITTMIEHPSVYECFKRLEEDGHDVTYVLPDKDGRVRPDDIAGAVRPETVMVSVMHVNNETGIIQPVEEIGRRLKQFPRVRFHVDAVQSVGKLALDPQAAGIDYLSVSAHKCHGPKGVGILYKHPSAPLSPLLCGGGQESGLRSGTENVPLIVGMAKALRMCAERREQNAAAMHANRRRLMAALKEISGVRVTGSGDEAAEAPHIVHFRVPGVKAEVLLHDLERQGFYVSSRSACSSGTEKPSRVLLAMGLSEGEAASGIRISLSPAHKADEVDALAAAIAGSVSQLIKQTEGVR